MPFLNLITPVEEAALKIPKIWTDELRRKVRQALKKLKPIKPNITKEERLAIKSQLGDENIIILLADKGNARVVMEKVAYSDKLAMTAIVRYKKKRKKGLKDRKEVVANP